MKKPVIKVTSSGSPPLAGANAFARLLVAAMAKKPDLKLVDRDRELKQRGLKG